MLQQVLFPSGEVNYFFRESAENLSKSVDVAQAVLITDEHVAQLYPHLFQDRKTLVIPAGENSKEINTISTLATQMLQMEATRHTLLIGVGGGVVTDITGFLASVYMRGVRFGYVPTTLLGMVDAAIGGKNGVDVGLHKNILGTIRQPEFIFYDTAFLQTLPDEEWSNGFAEIIKYACIFDTQLFDDLSKHNITYYKENAAALSLLIENCVAWKNKTVAIDEHEKNERKLLNFGHTVGHAIEKLYELPHGKAVAIGMVIAAIVSEAVTGIDKNETQQLINILHQYNLPTRIPVDTKVVMELLKTDKKRNNDTIDYISLQAIGKGIISPLTMSVIEKALATYESNR